MSRAHDIDVMARTIYGEARGEGALGMQAVACVIMNRIQHARWWGDDIESVCLTPWQFSCWNNNDPNCDVIEEVTDENPTFAAAIDLAKTAIDGELDDNTNGATSYFDRRMKVPPKWAKGRMPTATIGHHVFYKD